MTLSTASGGTAAQPARGREAGLTSSRTSGAALYVAAMACFSLSDVLVKHLTATLPVLEIVWFRYAALALTLAWLVLRRGAPARPRRPLLQAARGLAIVGSAVLFNIGLAHLPLASATALVFSSPLFVKALSVLVLRERVDWRRWAGVLLGFAGVLIVADPDPSTFDAAVLWPIASSAVWAVAMMLTRLVAADGDSATTTQAWSCGVGLVLLSAALPAVGVLPSSMQFVELLAMGLCWAMAQWLVVLAYERAEASAIAPFAYSQLIWANLLGIALLAQWPAPMTVFGSLVIAAAGLGASVLTRRRRGAGLDGRRLVRFAWRRSARYTAK